MKMSNENKAFSLIELLVVIAIVAIVSSLLAPTLSTAKEGAKQLKCLSNLHQLGLAVQMYGNDFGYYVPSYSGASEWSYILKPYLEKVGTVYSDPNDRSEVIVCPSRTIKLSNLETTYAAHRQVMVDTSGGALPRKFEDIPRMSEIIILGDAIQDPTFGGGKCFAAFDFNHADNWTTTGDPANSNAVVSPASANQDVGGVGENIRFRHKGNANMLFADGHAGAIKIDTFKERNVMLNY